MPQLQGAITGIVLQPNSKLSTLQFRPHWLEISTIQFKQFKKRLKIHKSKSCSDSDLTVDIDICLQKSKTVSACPDIFSVFNFAERSVGHAMFMKNLKSAFY